MSKLTREKELEIIEVSRGMFQSRELAGEVLAKTESLGPRLQMEMTGAQFDAIGFLDCPPGFTRRTSTCIGGDLEVLLLAGVLRSMQTACEHVWKNHGIAKLVFLAPRICVCEPCLPLFKEKFLEHDAKKEHLDECDLCLEIGVGDNFRQVTIAYRGAVHYGDVCPKCLEMVQDL